MNFVRMGGAFYRFSSFPDDSSSSKGRNLDVSLQLHLFLGSKEVLFLQFPKDATLSLQANKIKCTLLMVHFGKETFLGGGGAPESE